jgi:hypothetical protein
MNTGIAGLAKKAHSIKDIFGFLSTGDTSQFLHEVAKIIPAWIFKYNAGTIMATSSPKIVFRNYKNYISSPADIGDAPEISRLTGVSEATLLKRFEIGDKCYIIRDIGNDNRIINVEWGHRGACFIRGFGLNLNMGSDSIYLYGAYTLPEARMKGIFNTTFKDIYEFYKKENVTHIYALVEHENHYSYNLHQRLNFKPEIRVIYISILCFKFSCYKNFNNRKRRIKMFITAPQNMILI